MELQSNLAASLATHISGGRACNSDLQELAAMPRNRCGDLYAVLCNDPCLSTMGIEELDARSSTRTNLLNTNADHIAIKYSDDALLIIKSARRGFDVDYAADYLRGVTTYPCENECLIGGMYKVESIQKIEHPARMGQLKVYTLSEV